MKNLHKKERIFLTVLSLLLGFFNGNLLHASAGNVSENLNEEFHASNEMELSYMCYKLYISEEKWNECVRYQCRTSIEFEKPFGEKCKFIYQSTSNDSLAQLKTHLDHAKQLQDEINRFQGTISDDYIKGIAEKLPVVIQKMEHDLQHPFASKDIQRVLDYVMSFKTVEEQLDGLSQFGLYAQEAVYWKLCLLPEQQDQDCDYEKLNTLKDAIYEQIINQLKRDRKLLPLFRLPKEFRLGIIKLLSQDILMALLDDYMEKLSDDGNFDIETAFPRSSLYEEGALDNNSPEYTYLMYDNNRNVVVSIFNELNPANKHQCFILLKPILKHLDEGEIVTMFLSLNSEGKREIFPILMEDSYESEIYFGLKHFVGMFQSLNQDDQGRFFPIVIEHIKGGVFDEEEDSHMGKFPKFKCVAEMFQSLNQNNKGKVFAEVMNFAEEEPFEDEDFVAIFLSLNQDNKARFFPRAMEVAKSSEMDETGIRAMYHSMGRDNQGINFSYLPKKCFYKEVNDPNGGSHWVKDYALWEDLKFPYHFYKDNFKHFTGEDLWPTENH
ncbi:MAG: hypothetical protein LW808_002240 [Verrucomicrobiota bacterium]|nr:MAG: hypothetical protein LW808_002240 [Verrucomicrobiota bacterium]